MVLTRTQEHTNRYIKVPQNNKGCRNYTTRTSTNDVLHEKSRGLYAITVDDLWDNQPSNKKYKIKIGLAGGLNSGDCGGIAKRLDSYHTYYPLGFYIQALLKLKSRDAVAEAEKMLKKHLVDKLLPSTTRIQGEWFKLTIKELDSAFRMVHKKFMKDSYGLELFEKKQKKVD